METTALRFNLSLGRTITGGETQKAKAKERAGVCVGGGGGL